jgi:sigma-E factor negative regulatory protein RseC
MIEEHAIILNIEDLGNDQSVATIEVVRKTACGLCGKTQGCGNAIWGKLFAHKTTSFKAQNNINAKTGQHVIVGIDEKALMKSALLLYIVPLATMFVGAILASQISNSDLTAMIGAVIGVLLGYFWVKAHTTGRSYYQSHQPKILRLDVVNQEESSIQFQ